MARVVAFGKLAETCGEYLKKGRRVYVEGRLRTREFEAKDNCGKRQRTEIIASRIQFLGAPPADTVKAIAVDAYKGHVEVLERQPRMTCVRRIADSGEISNSPHTSRSSQ